MNTCIDPSCDNHKAIQRVVALHAPEKSSDGTYHCTACYDEWGYYEDYPCPTIKALGETE